MEFSIMIFNIYFLQKVELGMRRSQPLSTLSEGSIIYALQVLEQHSVLRMTF